MIDAARRVLTDGRNCGVITHHLLILSLLLFFFFFSVILLIVAIAIVFLRKKWVFIRHRVRRRFEIDWDCEGDICSDTWSATHSNGKSLLALAQTASSIGNKRNARSIASCILNGKSLFGEETVAHCAEG